MAGADARHGRGAHRPVLAGSLIRAHTLWREPGNTPQDTGSLRAMITLPPGVAGVPVSERMREPASTGGVLAACYVSPWALGPTRSDADERTGR